MNRFVSLLLAALSLAAVSLAQPAQAQWYRGQPYFLDSNSQSSQPGTSVTATINNPATGHVNITSNPGNTSTTYITSGSYSGSVGVYYVWGGGSTTRDMTLSTTQSLEATGAGTGNENGGSSAGEGYGAQASGQFSYNARAWDSKVSLPFSYTSTSGITPPSVNQVVQLGGAINPAYYNSSNPGPTIVTADVTFGAPIVSYPAGSLPESTP